MVPRQDADFNDNSARGGSKVDAASIVVLDSSGNDVNVFEQAPLGRLNADVHRGELLVAQDDGARRGVLGFLVCDVSKGVLLYGAAKLRPGDARSEKQQNRDDRHKISNSHGSGLERRED